VKKPRAYYEAGLAAMVPVEKTGSFLEDVRAGYYRYIQSLNYFQQQLGVEKTADTWDADFTAFLLASGVPQQYVAKVAYAAYERGHSGGCEEIVASSYDFIEIFSEKR
jgi:hypothetical protein